MTVLEQQLSKRAVDLSVFILAGVTVWYVTRQLTTQLEKNVTVVTDPLGELWSEISAKNNGWFPVELQPLEIRDHYLNADYTLTPEAERVLWSSDQWQPMMIEIFGAPGGVMKEKYRPLLNQRLEKPI
ncbi:hypothetical protein RJD39_04875 [Vibrio scophthalmi]|uniref:hypothetical protein n=1 Tax=Vibrio scophthalmi TaxID=45658 RepID=UPI0038731E94